MSTNHPIKAQLTAQDGGETIEFMFNPTQLDFSRSMQLNAAEGASTSSGVPKVSFAYPNPYEMTVGNLLFDTYETGANVVDAYISKFRKAVEFQGSTPRPPIYLFTWGSQEYLRCFVKSLRYKLTLFLADGTPVRAIVDLTLQEIDESTPSQSQQTPGAGANRSSDTRSRRSK